VIRETHWILPVSKKLKRWNYADLCENEGDNGMNAFMVLMAVGFTLAVVCVTAVVAAIASVLLHSARKAVLNHPEEELTEEQAAEVVVTQMLNHP
jgi:hypothetical protein